MLLLRMDDAHKILSLPCSYYWLPDSLCWHHEKLGRYSVKSGYHVGLLMRDFPCSSNKTWVSAWWNFFGGLALFGCWHGLVWLAKEFLCMIFVLYALRKKRLSYTLYGFVIARKGYDSWFLIFLNAPLLVPLIFLVSFCAVKNIFQFRKLNFWWFCCRGSAFAAETD